MLFNIINNVKKNIIKINKSKTLKFRGEQKD